MSHVPLSLMNRLNKTEPAVSKLWMLRFQRISFQIIEKTNNGTPHIGFDGYRNSPSIKDVTNERKTKANDKVGIKFDGKTPFKTKKELLLSNLETSNTSYSCLGTILRRTDAI